jgi:hypothetical protein
MRCIGEKARYPGEKSGKKACHSQDANPEAGFASEAVGCTSRNTPSHHGHWPPECWHAPRHADCARSQAWADPGIGRPPSNSRHFGGEGAGEETHLVAHTSRDHVDKNRLRYDAHRLAVMIGDHVLDRTCDHGPHCGGAGLTFDNRAKRRGYRSCRCHDLGATVLCTPKILCLLRVDVALHASLQSGYSESAADAMMLGVQICSCFVQRESRETIWNHGASSNTRRMAPAW